MRKEKDWKKKEGINKNEKDEIKLNWRSSLYKYIFIFRATQYTVHSTKYTNISINLQGEPKGLNVISK